MKRWISVILIALLSLPIMAQEEQDSVFFHKPDPLKAVWLGAIVPGAGQIYNKAYWKLPIVYGAFMGCGFAIQWNNNRYTSYKTAYIDLYNDKQAGTVSDDPSKSYIAVMPEGYDMSRLGGEDRWMSILQNQQSIYRRYRDYSILATVIVYALSMIDAYVDAQLFDYDISPDLTLNVEPQIYYDLQHQKSAELKLAIQF